VNVLSGILLGLGFFFIFVAAIGILRLPDFYTRLHASGKSETMGILLICLGLALYEGVTLNSLKIVLVAAFIFFANPVGTHIISRAAYIAGLKPWVKEGEKEGNV